MEITAIKEIKGVQIEKGPVGRMEVRKRRILIPGKERRIRVNVEGRRREMEARKIRDPLAKMEPRKIRIRVEGIRRTKVKVPERRQEGMEARKRRIRVGGIRRTREVKLEGRSPMGGMEMAKRTIMQTKRTAKKIEKIIMVKEVERKEERTVETQGLGIIMALESQHTTSFGVLIFHWSKFCKNVWKTR